MKKKVKYVDAQSIDITKGLEFEELKKHFDAIELYFTKVEIIAETRGTENNKKEVQKFKARYKDFGIRSSAFGLSLIAAK